MLLLRTNTSSSRPSLFTKGVFGALPEGSQAQTSHSLANPVQGPLFGGLYQTDQAQRRLCLIPELGARPKANYHQLPFLDLV